MILNPNIPMGLLSTPEEKEILLKRYGMDEVEVVPFDKKISKLPAFLFLREELIKKRNARGIVVGNDFRFGVGRSAGALELVRWGLEFEIPIWVVPPIKHQRKTVSSTLIRDLFSQNKYRAGQGFLGHPYLIGGKVVKGRSLGKKLGFPTANLDLPPGKVVPRGVFVVRAKVDHREYKGVCNIGVRPTLGRKNKVSVEAHLFGKPGSLRGKWMSLELVSWIRAEKRFKSLSELTRAIKKDVAKANASKVVHFQAK
jgi:riboflavin kinase/FMN adenylyltransferase